MKIKIGIVSLGCARNLVDSEVMCGYFKAHNLELVDDIKAADVAVVNTCAFIKDAKVESIDLIVQLIDLKKQGKIKKIIVAGCLAQRYLKELKQELKEVDGFIGPGGVGRVIEVINDVLKGARPQTLDDLDYLYNDKSPRLLLTPRHSVYVKIAEGCRNKCNYCVISKIRGKYRSRTINSLLSEIKNLGNMGAKEINLISQDSTLYGTDLYKTQKIAALIKKISCVPGIGWIRLLYTHPAHFNDSLIRQFKINNKLCRYVDLPLQHINDTILTKMNRHTTKAQILALIDKLRKIPGLAIRTTFIVGFPGETDRQFTELADFIREIKFERMGVFVYSREQGTPAANFKPQIPEAVKLNRFNIIMRQQQKIAESLNKNMLGSTLKVIVDSYGDKDKSVLICRSEFDAPDVDGLVFVKTKKAHKNGDFLNAKIIEAREYDLVAEEKL